MKTGTILPLSTFAAALMIAGTVTAVPGYSADKSLIVSGDSKPSECGTAKKPTFAMELSGSFVGCWSIFVGHSNCQDMNGFVLYTEIGREEFEGKLDGKNTTFDTTYTFTGIFPKGSCPAPAPEKEIVGGCTHYISGKGLVGVVRFYDVMQGKDSPHYFYEGTLSQS